MLSKLQYGLKYCQYWLSANNGQGHGVHSPFVFSFIQNVLLHPPNALIVAKIETQREILKKDNRLLQYLDLGAGSVKGNKQKKSVKDIANTALKAPKYAQLLGKITAYYQPKTMIELGTSLGLTTAYMALNQPESLLYTFEGIPAVASVARSNFNDLEVKNITIIEGNLNQSLDTFLQQNIQIDLAFLDGNHQYMPTLNYFESLLKNSTEHSIFILDDIYWSQAMQAAWKKIQQHPAVSLTIDLFVIGLVFLKTDFKEKQHFVIRY